MKLADLKLATELQDRLAALDEWPASAAELVLDGDGRDGPIRLPLSADELAAFVEWRRGGIKAELRRLGIDTGDGQVGHNETARQRDNPREQQPRAAAQSGAAASGLTRDQAYAAARDYFLADHETMLARGLIDQAEFDRIAAQRADRIRERAEELLHAAAPAQCEDCIEPATTVIAGRNFCDSHAEARPRLVPPSERAA